MTPSRQHYRNLSSEPWTLQANGANVCRLIFAVLWTLLWGTARFIDNCLHHPNWAIVTLHAMAFSWGRRNRPRLCGANAAGWGRSAGPSTPTRMTAPAMSIRWMNAAAVDAIHSIPCSRAETEQGAHDDTGIG